MRPKKRPPTPRSSPRGPRRWRQRVGPRRRPEPTTAAKPTPKLPRREPVAGRATETWADRRRIEARPSPRSRHSSLRASTFSLSPSNHAFHGSEIGAAHGARVETRGHSLPSFCDGPWSVPRETTSAHRDLTPAVRPVGPQRRRRVIDHREAQLTNLAAAPTDLRRATPLLTGERWSVPRETAGRGQQATVFDLEAHDLGAPTSPPRAPRMDKAAPKNATSASSIRPRRAPPPDRRGPGDGPRPRPAGRPTSNLPNAPSSSRPSAPVGQPSPHHPHAPEPHDLRPRVGPRESPSIRGRGGRLTEVREASKAVTPHGRATPRPWTAPEDSS